MTPWTAWFAREILVHEESLVRYLARSWPKPDEVHDLRQDIYVRVYESALRARPAAPRPFCSRRTRNLMTDRVRRGTHRVDRGHRRHRRPESPRR